MFKSSYQVGKFHRVTRNAAIRDWERDELNVGALADGWLIGKIKVSNFMHFQQRHDCLHAQAFPSVDFVCEPFSAAWAGHYGEADAFGFT